MAIINRLKQIYDPGNKREKMRLLVSPLPPDPEDTRTMK